MCFCWVFVSITTDLVSCFLLIRVESLQFLEEDVAVGDSVVLVGHNEELENGPSARPEKQDGSVSVRPSFCIHHHLVQLVPTGQGRWISALTAQCGPVGLFFRHN